MLHAAHGDARAASPSTSLAWYQGVGQGFTSDRELLLIPSNATFSASGTRAHVSVAAVHELGRFTVSFAAPPGRLLLPGKHYVRAQRAGAAEAGRPGVHLSAPDFDCWGATGSFE